LSRENLRMVINHGQIKATLSGPSVHVNSNNIHATLNRFVREILEKDEHEYHVFVFHAYPWTGNIPGYISNLERAKNKIRQRVLMLNRSHLSSNNPVSIILDYAEKLGIHIIFGPLYEIAGPRLYKTTIMVTPAGDIVKYRAMCLSEVEKRIGINPGREPVVFEVKDKGRVIGRLGVFIDEDLTCPEPFRFYNIARVDAVVGHLLPYSSRYLEKYEEGHVVTVKPCILDKFITIRAIDAGAPLILVGGVLTLHAGGRRVTRKYWGPTTVADPEGPGSDECPTLRGYPEGKKPFLTVDDIDVMKKIIIEGGQAAMRLDEVPLCSRAMRAKLRKTCTGQG